MQNLFSLFENKGIIFYSETAKTAKTEKTGIAPETCTCRTPVQEQDQLAKLDTPIR